MNYFKDQRASVLIMVLWSLTLLAVFAIQIGVMTRDKISFLARADRQSVLRHAAKGGVAKALALIKNDFVNNKEKNLLQTQLALYFNTSGLRNLEFGQAEVSVEVTDEYRRLNINFADQEVLQRLLVATGAASEDEAGRIATAIYDWRMHGESEIEGFSSDDFYDSLEFPYPQKKGKFETLDELLLVEGMNERNYAIFVEHVTVYGSPVINMNTVSWQVLVAYGFTPEQAKMAETIRPGPDGKEGTLDDNLLKDAESFITQIASALGLEEEELSGFRAVSRGVPFVEASDVFRVHSIAKLDSRKENKSITCVFDAKDDKISYWRER